MRRFCNRARSHECTPEELEAQRLVQIWLWGVTGIALLCILIGVAGLFVYILTEQAHEAISRGEAFNVFRGS